MNTLRFMDYFSTEEACKNHFRIQREQEGINCKKIGDTYHSVLNPQVNGSVVIVIL